MPLLFSYGTLQDEAVQLSTFGRLLVGQPDELLGFEQESFEVKDPEFVLKSGKSHHATVRFTGSDDATVRGTVFELTQSELEKSDNYEPAGYKRVLAHVKSGRVVWVYADSRFS